MTARLLAACILAAVVAPASAAETVPRADRPQPRTDANSQVAHQQLLRKRTQGRIDAYFLGDSITRRWGTSDEKYAPLLANWRANFFGWNAADFGWGGDTTQNILWRLKEGELDGVHPKVIVLMAGTNNVGNKTPESVPRRADEIARGVKAIVAACRHRAPSATLVLMGITPRNDNPAVMPLIDAVNARLASFADGRRVRYLSINAGLADAQGVLFPGMTDPDRLHLTPLAYQVWADALKPLLTELLGPPAAEDHAPPPTGDPSAAHPPAAR